MSSVLFHISGHGYGHARRMSQVIAALLASDPAIAVHVRTAAPARIFAGLIPPDRVTPTAIDAGAAEHSPLEIDGHSTLARIAVLLTRRDAIVDEEVDAIRPIRPALIVSDIPFLSGDVAAASGIPCIGISNFSWDWIVEPFVDRAQSGTRDELHAGGCAPGSRGSEQRARLPNSTYDLRDEHDSNHDRTRGHSPRRDRSGHHGRVLDDIARGYRAMEGILRLPLGGISDAFRTVIDVPLVANRSRRDPADVLRQLGIDPADDRRRVLFGLRGAVPTDVLAAAAAASGKHHLILCPTNEPGEVPPGVLPVPVGSGLDFSDVLQACDVVVGKMGYGLIAECIASGVALLWPRRLGFREDEIVERDGPAVLRMRELPLNDFHAGRWAEHVNAAAVLPKPPVAMATNGAFVCARWIIERISER